MISDLIMYLKYYKKNIFLYFLKKRTGLDYDGRYEETNKDLRGYEGCYPIKHILKKMNITQNDSILDIGCGKGLFLFYASKFNFRNIDGIEYSKSIFEIAKLNTTILLDNRINVINIDARDFPEYNNYNYIFINNPFSNEIMKIVVKKIVESKKSDEKITIIYQFPFNKEVFLSKGFEVQYDKFPNMVLTFQKK